MRMVLFLALLVPLPSAAQTSARQGDDGEQQVEVQPPQPQFQPLPTRPIGRVAPSAVGEVGQRRTREEAEGIEPLARIDTRVANRVQSRLRTRIDRSYDPQANPASATAIAQDRARTAGRSRR